ncbi:uncharacterized protein LOC144159974 [Haemaphysalis longicornis]
MSPATELVGAVADHMATRSDNRNDSDGANHLPPVGSEPVLRLVEAMIPGTSQKEYVYAAEEPSDEDTLMDTWAPTTADDSLVSELAEEQNLEPAGTLPGASSCDNSDRGAAGTSAKRPKGRMGVLESKLSEENDARAGLLQEEHDLRVQLMKEESKATVEAVRLQCQAAVEQVQLETEAILGKIRLETQLLKEKGQLEKELIRLRIQREQAFLAKALAE